MEHKRHWNLGGYFPCLSLWALVELGSETDKRQVKRSRNLDRGNEIMEKWNISWAFQDSNNYRCCPYGFDYANATLRMTSISQVFNLVDLGQNEKNMLIVPRFRKVLGTLSIWLCQISTSLRFAQNDEYKHYRFQIPTTIVVALRVRLR